MNLPVCDPCLLGQERSACTQLQGASGKPQSATTPLGATTRCRVLLLAGTHGNALPRRRLPHLASVHRASGQGAFTTTAPPNFERARCCGACRLGKNPAPRARDAQKGGAAEAAGKRGKRHPPRPGPSTNRIQPTTHPEPRTPSAPCRLAAAPVNPSSSSSFPLPPSSRERVFPFSPLPLACRPRPLTLPFPAPTPPGGG